MRLTELRQIIREEIQYALKKDSVTESYYDVLGGDKPLTDEEMRKTYVVPNLGTSYDAYIMFEGPKGVYDQMKKKYASNTDAWKMLYRSKSGQGKAKISPDGKVIAASVFADMGLVGAIYVKK